MRFKLLSIIIGMLVTLSSFGQKKELNNSFGLGGQVTQYQNDFGVGLNMVSPYFAKGILAFRLRGNLMWKEHLNSNGKIDWSPYANLSIGMVSIAGKIGSNIRVYGEGGLMVLLPSNRFSSENFQVGGYGLFGFEFFFHPQNNYFIEIGGVGTGARADKVLEQPIYSNGLLITAGYRYQF